VYASNGGDFFKMPENGNETEMQDVEAETLRASDMETTQPPNETLYVHNLNEKMNLESKSEIYEILCIMTVSNNDYVWI
jgi:hypothetical protein